MWNHDCPKNLIEQLTNEFYFRFAFIQSSFEAKTENFKRLNSRNLSLRMEFEIEIENSELLSLELEISACIINVLLCAFLDQVLRRAIIVQKSEPAWWIRLDKFSL